MPFRRNIAHGALTLVTIGLLVFLGVAPSTLPLRENVAKVFSYALFGVRRISWQSDAAEYDRERIGLLQEIASREEYKRENALLREALHFKNDFSVSPMPAAVIGFLREGREEYLLLNRGVIDGVRQGDVVVSQNRVFVGMIASVASRVSHVLLVTSPSRSTDVSLAGTAIRAIAKGNNDRELIIDLVPQQTELKVGDLLVASPRSTGLALPILVGEVREVKQAENEIFKFVRAIHLFDPSDDEVIILSP